MENQQNANVPQNDPQPKSEPSLQDLAEIIDLDFDPNDPVTSRHHTTAENSENSVIDVEAIEEEAVFHDEFDPEQNRTKVSIQKHPLAKSAVIVGGTLAIIGGSATFFLSQIPKDQVATVPEKKEPVNEQVQSAQSAATKAQQSESEAKAELALSRQRDSLAQATSSPQPSSGQSSPAASPTATTPASPTTAATSPQPTRTVRTPVPPIVIQPVASTTPTRQRSAAPATAPIVTAAAQPNYTARRAESNSGRQQVRTIATQPQTVAARVQSTAATPRIQRSVDRVVSAVEIGSRSTAPGVPRVSRTAAPSVPARTQQRTESEPPVIARTQRRTESEPPVVARTQRRTESENPVVPSTTAENPVVASARLPIVPAPGVARTDSPSGDMAPPPPLEAPTAAGGTLAVATAPSIREYLSQAVDGTTTTAAVPVKTATTASAPVTTAAPIATASPAAIARANVVTTAPVAIASVSQSAAPVATQRVEQAAVRGRSRSAYETESAMNRTMARIVPAPGMTDVTSIADGGVAPPANIPTQEAAMEAASLPITVAIDDAPNGARTAYANTRLLMASAERASGALGADPVPVAPVSKASGKEQAVVETNPVLQIQSGSTGRESNYSFMASSLLIGTSAKTSTLTPVLWGGDGTASNAKFVLKLEEPLLASNRREAFPAGTQLIVVAKPASANVSIADVEVVSIVIGGKEYAAPPGTLVIRDEQNGLLVGEDYYRRDEQIANRDTMTFVTGALSTVGQMMNRPTSTYSSTNTGNFGGTATNVVTNGAPNLLGAVLEGGFRDLPSMWSQRNQQALAELATKPRIYQIPKGRTVRVFVNQSIDF
jgi:Bacterial conjugation TrbI-like protein